MNNLQKVLSEGRLIRGAWAREEEGRQLLCLYTALAGDPYARPHTCPANLCPSWLANLLPAIDDSGSLERWPAVVERVARLSPGFSSLPAEIEYRVRALIVREAMSHTTDGTVLAVCQRVVDLCHRRGGGETVQEEDFSAACSAAWSAADSAAENAAENAARNAARSAAWSAARSAAWSAAKSAAYSSAWSATWSEAWSEAQSVAWDRMIDGILDTIEEALS